MLLSWYSDFVEDIGDAGSKDERQSGENGLCDLRPNRIDQDINAVQVNLVYGFFQHDTIISSKVYDLARPVR